MRLAKWIYSRESVCPCGFRILRDEVPLGTAYVVDEDSIGPGTLICGGCGESRRMSMIDVQGQGGDFFPLPVEIFEVKAADA